MAEDTSIKFYSFEMARSPQLIPNNATQGVRNLLNNCLVTGFGEVNITSGIITDGVCRMFVVSGDSFSNHSTITVSGVTPEELNGEHKVIRMTDMWFEFKTELPNGAVTGTSVKAKYAPAGWEHAFTPSGEYAVYRSKSSSPNARKHYLQVREMSYQEVRVKAFHSMTSNTSGIENYPLASTGYPNGCYWSKSYQNNALGKGWAIIASDTFFYLLIAPYDTYYTDYIYSCMFFGDFIPRTEYDTENSVLKGFVSITASNNNISDWTHEVGTSHTTAKDGVSPIISGSSLGNANIPVIASMFSDVASRYNSYGISGHNYGLSSDPYTGGINLTEYKLMDQHFYERGKLPGLYYLKQSINRTYGNLFFLNGTGDFEGKKLLGVYLQGGNSYFSYPISNNSGNPAYMFFDITGPWS